jgi:hypothetical protein
MDVAVGIGRAVVQHVARAALGVLAQLLVEAHFLPAGDDSGSFLGRPARMGNSVCGMPITANARLPAPGIEFLLPASASPNMRRAAWSGSIRLLSSAPSGECRSA